ncbi:MAG: phage virion morphogenesis protein [Paracoccus sp. (in: a-proteobacteria)]|uniref:phage virion morphogenesis protein n=1 Tax=Paracoccus sp. TaxID=267 RepID=UPI0026DEE442|nr:phage virion morphogenesis protein [Paracoccus sp. (in: a-proteobacteria)]MDO5631134.1 phage virion morphogenesis protein [Paracoccus sp. (in: a-proteobacteria)]
MGVALTLEITDRGFDAVVAAMARLADPADQFELMDSIGRLVQEQTRHRISAEKTGPDGTAWAPNQRGTSILYASHRLAESIDYIANLDEIKVGSPLNYARIHQTGGKISAKSAKSLRFFAGANNQPIYVKSVTIPARPYLGLSTENIADIEDAVAEFTSAVFEGAGE